MTVRDAICAAVYRTGMVTKRPPGRPRGQLSTKRVVYLAEHMDDARMGDQQLADKLGVSRETVTRWRNNSREISPPTLARIAIALDKDAAELLRPPFSGPSIDALLHAHGADNETRRWVHETVAQMLSRLSRGR